METKIKEHREKLKALSNQVKPLVEAGKFETINAAIIELFYKNDGNEIFKKFKEWKKEKKIILKGSKSFVVWAKPLKAQKQKQETSPEEQDEYSFFPICHLFSNKQVV